MTPEDIWLLILFLVLLLLILLWWFRWRMLNPPPVPPQGWLLEAGRGHEIRDECGGTGDTLYTNLAVRLHVSVEILNSGSCTVVLSTRATPNFLRVRPDAKRAAAVTLAPGDRLSYVCEKDESGANCLFEVRIQRL